MINWLSNVKPLKAVLMILSLLVISYVFVHLFALLGIFIAVAYPLWWILFPQLTACIYCRNTPIGKKCPSCGMQVENKVTPPRNLKSVIVNSLTIILISITCIGTVYVEYRLLENRFLEKEENIVEFIIPESKQYKIGEIFPVDLDVDTNNIAINAVQTDLNFQPESVEIVKVSLEKSFAQIFIQNEVNNEKGYLRVTGGLPNPGFVGERGHFATIYFRSKKAGLVEIAYLPTSLVLENNGNGNNILKNYPKITYLIKPEYISDTEREIQDQIYSNSVLGVSSTDEQILFFDDSEDFVLGAETSAENIEEASENRYSLGDIILKIDLWIIDFFKSILALFK